MMTIGTITCCFFGSRFHAVIFHTRGMPLALQDRAAAVMGRCTVRSSSCLPPRMSRLDDSHLDHGVDTEEERENMAMFRIMRKTRRRLVTPSYSGSSDDSVMVLYPCASSRVSESLFFRVDRCKNVVK